MTAFIAMASSTSQIDQIFSTVYFTVFGGGVIVGVNAYLVGSEASILMMISILGYSLFPFVVASVINYLFRKIIMFLGVFFVLILDVHCLCFLLVVECEISFLFY
jgi:hypothetical protein